MQSSATVCLAMIVRNEADVIEESLSRVCPYIDYWVVCDTGSTDNTGETVRRFFQKQKIPGELYHDEWQDFAHNRTLAFQRAQSRADYVWVLDADDLLTGTFVLPTVMEADAYSLVYGDDSCIRFQRPQLFSTKLEWEYRGVVHEFPCRVDSLPYSLQSIEGDYFIDYMHSRKNTTNDRGKNPLKYLRDAELMERALATENNKVYYWRYVYYIAQSYFDYGDYEKAIVYFRRHLEGVRSADTYFCHFFLASALQQLDKVKHEAEVVDHYLKGLVLEPARAECPYFLARLYFDSAQYEKALAMLLLCKDMNLPENGYRVMSSLYRFDVKWLTIQTCHILQKTEEERRTWRVLFQEVPEVAERVDVRLFTTAVELLTTTHPFPNTSIPDHVGHQVALLVGDDDTTTLSSLRHTLTDPQTLAVVSTKDEAKGHRYRLRRPLGQWLFVRPWSLSEVVSLISDLHLSKMYLSKGETLFAAGSPETGEHLWYVEDTHATEDNSEWCTDSVCTRYPLASYESITTLPDHQSSTTVTLATTGISYFDFLTAFFLFTLCAEFNFNLRFSHKHHRGTTPFCGPWETKDDLRAYLMTQPVLSTGDFFRVEWLPVDFREVAWPRFQQFVGASTTSEERVLDTSFRPRYFADVLGIQNFVVRGKEEPHAHWPLVAHLAVLFGVSVRGDDDVLPFDCVASELKSACWQKSVALRVASDNVTNQILNHAACFGDEGDEACDMEMLIEEDYVLSGPFLTWQVRFMDFFYGIRSRRHDWAAVDLCDPPQTDAAKSPFRIVRRGFSQSTTTLHYPLLRRLVVSTTTTESAFLFFSELHFVDSEVYYSPTPLTPERGAAFDAYNSLGFYKRWVPGRVQHFQCEPSGSGYPGDWVSASCFQHQEKSSRFNIDFRNGKVPLLPKDQMPVYCVHTNGEDEKSIVARFEKQRLSVRCVGLLQSPVCAHLHLWKSLSQDPCHDYYVIIEDHVTFSDKSPYLDGDAQASLAMVLKTLDEEAAWDLVILGVMGGSSSGCGTMKKGVVSVAPCGSYEGRAGGYILHKKAACFLLEVIRYMGLPTISLDEFWRYYSTEQPFLNIFRVATDLV